MDFDVILPIIGITLLLCGYIVIIGSFILVAIGIATTLGVTSIMWWAVVIVSFIVLLSVVGYFTR